jgi:tRNA pseudouridine38-40 synthase
MRNLKMTLAYVGTLYAGWQVQPRQPTIQGVLEARLTRMLQEKVRIAGAGRTDAGVHARGQVANFLTASRIPLAGLRRGLNAILPEDVRVMEVEEAPDGFQARADAYSKEYVYRIACAEVISPFDSPFVAAVRGHLDTERMGEAARRFLGRHDFRSFCPAQVQLEDTRRTLFESRIERRGDRVEYRVRGDGFLQHMVRTLAGTLIQIGRGLRPPEAVEEMIQARDRRAAGPCAAARGLVLERVFYEEVP